MAYLQPHEMLLNTAPGFLLVVCLFLSPPRHSCLMVTLAMCLISSSLLSVHRYSGSAFLGNIKSAFEKNENLQILLLDDFFKDAIHKCQVRKEI